MAKEIYILTQLIPNKPLTLGVFSSKKQVNKFLDKFLSESGSRRDRFEHEIVFKQWTINSEQPYCWDWVFVPKNCSRDLSSGGAIFIPKKEFWGTNIFKKREAFELIYDE